LASEAVSSTIAVENRGFPSDQFDLSRGLAWLLQVLSLDPCCGQTRRNHFNLIGGMLCAERHVSPEQRVHFAKRTCRDLTKVKEQLAAAPPAAEICHAPQTF
jgi:hypothetical protein